MLHEQKFQVTMIMILFLLWFGWYAIRKKETKNSKLPSALRFIKLGYLEQYFFNAAFMYITSVFPSVKIIGFSG